MAKHNFSGAPPSQNTIYVVEDLERDTILEVRSKEYVVIEPDGSLSSYTRDQNIQLVCGLAWNPSMLEANPPVYVGLCASCRNPGIGILGPRRKSHGMVAMHRAKLCTCGILCCPRHRRIGQDDKWRCLSCDMKHRITNFTRPLFFRRER